MQKKFPSKNEIKQIEQLDQFVASPVGDVQLVNSPVLEGAIGQIAANDDRYFLLLNLKKIRQEFRALVRRSPPPLGL